MHVCHPIFFFSVAHAIPGKAQDPAKAFLLFEPILPRENRALKDLDNVTNQMKLNQDPSLFTRKKKDPFLFCS